MNLYSTNPVDPISDETMANYKDLDRQLNLIRIQIDQRTRYVIDQIAKAYNFEFTGWKLGPIGYSYLSGKEGKVGIEFKVWLANNRLRPLSKAIKLDDGEVWDWCAEKSEDGTYQFTFPQSWIFLPFEEELNRSKLRVVKSKS